jgi:hypothetical protein
MTAMAENLPGKGLWGWLGRQIGYVKTAAKAKVKAPATPKVVYRKDHVEEAVVPEQPHVKLRRTTIDEVIVEREGTAETRNPKPE